MRAPVNLPGAPSHLLQIPGALGGSRPAPQPLRAGLSAAKFHLLLPVPSDGASALSPTLLAGSPLWVIFRRIKRENTTASQSSWRFPRGSPPGGSFPKARSQNEDSPELGRRAPCRLSGSDLRLTGPGAVLPPPPHPPVATLKYSQPSLSSSCGRADQK